MAGQLEKCQKSKGKQRKQLALDPMEETSRWPTTIAVFAPAQPLVMTVMVTTTMVAISG